MAGFLNNYILYISVSGIILLTFLSFCCFINVEAMRLPKGTKNGKGFATLIAALVTINNLDLCRNSCLFTIL
jgi:hypothetical protein